MFRRSFRSSDRTKGTYTGAQVTRQKTPVDSPSNKPWEIASTIIGHRSRLREQRKTSDHNEHRVQVHYPYLYFFSVNSHSETPHSEILRLACQCNM